ncbi:ribosome hibernation-promoting factor, HPF/YfiA family [Desulfuromonas acetoxidans]|uniref:Ribosome hibernation promoting factor n=1 Tax=Desulfuromonas acetoxidans (strain DSM 684 / 11070) TaxID=281689 RepID=Q1K310_DESA6|nr:ribosome-associated translation inhibitor RaiA [Desulfuromonas acetoxidans]EAT16721.1 sigma 54 modulation protein/ribosomal protein S30EA [Desulfuromonas acetoxidans DSM 684]MBF0644807.1 ribosome-associated translation inhibitor RaiA [Desulfuromonas acetoxidans]NVD23660.1 ribosome-associated translation inhibitor RaiA [Desulfuromonas acetoxidans]NVE15955.1 ribosome-associated translation inhibitor RaiA [Desulfuromonas acetoxidans]
MQISVTFRHMDTSEPVRNYVEEKLVRVNKYIEEPIDAQVVLTVEKKIRHNAEVALVAKGVTIKASAEVTDDMYAAIDAVVDKLERQLKRYKEKLKRHSSRKGKERDLTKTIYEAASVEEGHPEPKVIRSHSFSIKPMSVDEAVMQMDLLQKEFLVFTDDDTEEVNVIYRRKDGNYGLIVPKS